MTNEEYLEYIKRIDTLGEENPTEIFTLQLMVTILSYVESQPAINREWLESKLVAAGC